MSALPAGPPWSPFDGTEIRLRIVAEHGTLAEAPLRPEVARDLARKLQRAATRAEGSHER